MNESIKIYIADDQEITLIGLRSIQNLVPNICIIGETNNLDIAMMDIMYLQPDVAILDLLFDGDAEAGANIIREIIQRCPQQKIIALSNWNNLLNQARLAGAVAVSKDINLHDLVDLIRTVHKTDVAKLRILNQSTREIERTFLANLATIKPGREHAYAFEQFMAKLLVYLFADQLTESRSQLRNAHGTQIRDIVFLNTGTTDFWNMLLQRHDAGLVVFELKNVRQIRPTYFYQLITYLANTTGRFGCLIGRMPITDQIKHRQRDTLSANDRIILYLSDQEITDMLAIRTKGRSPEIVLARLYADLVGSI